MDEFSNTNIFELRERESLETNGSVRPYTAITKVQLVGLLVALGEYECRVNPDTPPYIRVASNDPEPVSSDLELAEAHHALVSSFSRRRTSDTAPAGQWFADGGKIVFDAPERSAISLRKYIRGQEDITKQQVLGILQALGRYPLRAPRIEEVLGIHTGIVRMVHAHNALLSFREKPFTLDEFAESVRAVLRGENSRLTPLEARRSVKLF